MKKLALISGLLLAGIVSNAQQLTFSSQYMVNPYFTNPGAAGSTDYSPIAMTIRSQWVGFDEAPRTQSISFHTKVEGHNAIGFMLYNDVTGPLRKINFQGSYAYHVEFSNRSKLGLGLSMMVKQHSLDGTTFTLNSSTDQVLTNGLMRSVNYDADFGAFYYTDDYYFGFSVPQLFQGKYKFGDNIQEMNIQRRHLYMMGAYRFKVDENWDVTPSFLFKSTHNAPAQFELTGRAEYQKMFWGGLSWRMKESVVIMAGAVYQNFVLGYSYDITTNNLRNYSSGTHEIYLAYRIAKMNKKESVGRLE